MPASEPPDFDWLGHNAAAWDAQAQRHSPWSEPVSASTIAAARQGDWRIYLTPEAVPADWLGDVSQRRILCLAAAGGQQAPVLAAAGAQVTVFDLSPAQLALDAMVAERDGLTLTLEQGDMRDLSRFADASFDLIVHPVSNQYVPDIQPVWAGCYRVLRPGGALLSSFFHPACFIADRDPRWAEQGVIRPRYRAPYSDLTALDAQALADKQARQEPLRFGHTLQQQIGGQLAAGLVVTGWQECMHPAPRLEIEKYLPSFIATRSVKP